MSLTYASNDFYSDINNQMSLVKGYTPANMTLVPNVKQPVLLTPMVPQVSTDVKTVSQNIPNLPARKAKDTKSNVIKESQQKKPDIVEPEAEEHLTGFDKWFREFFGLDNKESSSAEDALETAGMAEYGSFALKSIGALYDANQYTNLRRDIEKTKSQYESQKKIIDTNIDKTESALMENLMSNMADLDVMSAAKNVDLSSQAITGDKVKGAMDLGKDIADMRTNGALQKAALDLEYAINVRKAKQNEINSYVSAGLQIAGSALALL